MCTVRDLPADTLSPVGGVATVRRLERLGHEVVFPEDQTCCGQMHVSTGYAQPVLMSVSQPRFRR